MSDEVDVAVISVNVEDAVNPVVVLSVAVGTVEEANVVTLRDVINGDKPLKFEAAAEIWVAVLVETADHSPTSASASHQSGPGPSLFDRIGITEKASPSSKVITLSAFAVLAA